MSAKKSKLIGVALIIGGSTVGYTAWIDSHWIMVVFCCLATMWGILPFIKNVDSKENQGPMKKAENRLFMIYIFASVVSFGVGVSILGWLGLISGADYLRNPILTITMLGGYIIWAQYLVSLTHIRILRGKLFTPITE